MAATSRCKDHSLLLVVHTGVAQRNLPVAVTTGTFSQRLPVRMSFTLCHAQTLPIPRAVRF
jgi:hypothetical protein